MKAHAQAMVLAAFAADSFSLGTHWIYDTDKIKKQFGEVTDLLAPHEGSYHPGKNTGDFTHYGDQSFHLLQSLVRHHGNYDNASYAKEWQAFMSDYTGYLDHASKETLQIMADKTGDEAVVTCGSQSSDLGGPVRIAPLIYCYRENLEPLLEAVSNYTVLTHSGTGTVEGARFLAASCFSILHGASPREAIENSLEHLAKSPELQQQIRQCLQSTDLDTLEQVKKFGQMCNINNALPGAIYTVLKNEDDLEQALIETVMAGGDSAARGMAAGMLLAAHLGKSKLPSRWLVKMSKYQEIMAGLQQIE